MTFVERLTKRDVDVCLLAVQGKNVPEIAELLGVDKNAVKRYMLEIRAKLNAKSHEELIVILLGNPGLMGNPNLEPRSPFPGEGEELTTDEEDVLKLVLEGDSVQEISNKLKINLRLAKLRIQTLLKKRDCRDRRELIAKIARPVRVSA